MTASSLIEMEELARKWLAKEFDNPVNDDPDLLKSLTTLLATARAREGWQTIETAPRNNSAMRLWQHPCETVGYFDTVKLKWFIAWTGLERDSVKISPTHWMPLDAPPSTPERG